MELTIEELTKLKIKEMAYENVNKKIEEEKKETERKINSELEIVEETLKYIKNKLIFGNTSMF